MRQVIPALFIMCVAAAVSACSKQSKTEDGQPTKPGIELHEMFPLVTDNERHFHRPLVSGSGITKTEYSERQVIGVVSVSGKGDTDACIKISSEAVLRYVHVIVRECIETCENEWLQFQDNGTVTDAKTWSVCFPVDARFRDGTTLCMDSFTMYVEVHAYVTDRFQSSSYAYAKRNLLNEARANWGHQPVSNAPFVLGIKGHMRIPDEC